ncbi:MAG: mobile mystery protein B [Gaiellaceae bacterium]
MDPDEAAELLPSWISNRGDLDTAEQENIARAIQWAASRRLPRETILREDFVRELHRRMFSDVWRWAGTYRQTTKNLGVPAEDIVDQVAVLLGDVAYWIENTVYGRDEIAVRFHHRLVFVHPFPNGNGRHARLAADLLVVSLGGVRFTWGQNLSDVADVVRRTYIATLKSADGGAFEGLDAFARM